MKAQLGMGFACKQVYEEHRQHWILWRKIKHPDMRDDLVQLRYIAYYKSILKMGVWRRHHNEFDSVKMWALEHLNDVFIWYK